MSKQSHEGKKLYYYIGTQVIECDGYVWADSPYEANSIVKKAIRNGRISSESFDLMDVSVRSREVTWDSSMERECILVYE